MKPFSKGSFGRDGGVHPWFAVPGGAVREALEEQAVRMRAEAVHQLVGAVGKGTVAAGRVVLDYCRAFGAAVAARHQYDELRQLDDGALAKLGLRREDIPRHVFLTMERRLGRTDPGSSATASAPIDPAPERPERRPEAPRPQRRAA